MTEKVKIGGVEFDVIDTAPTCHEIAREIGIPLDAETSNTPLAIKLNGKLRLLQLMKHDLDYMKSIVKICDPEFTKINTKQLNKVKRKFKKVEKEAYDICRELGWIKDESVKS